ncbi:MAG: ABC transporter substrate-binding protein [bacterium]|nr:ABC transporter substrate-binding protein [bacterium]
MKQARTARRLGSRGRLATRSRWAALIAVIALVAAACGGDDGTTGAPPASEPPPAPADSPAPPPDPAPAPAGDDPAPPPAAPGDDPPPAPSGEDAAPAPPPDPAPAPAGDDPAPPPEPPPSDDAAPAPPPEPAPAPPEAPPAPPPEPQPTTGFDGETLTLGYLVDQSGPLAIIGGPLLAGSQLYWDWVNDELGGIAGRYRVELAVGDTKDSEGATVQEYQRLKDDVVMFAEVLSTPPVQALLEFLNEDGIVAVPGSLAGSWAREPLLMPAGATYEYEGINLADWYVNHSGLASASDVYCAVYVNDKYGRDSLRGVEFAGARLGFSLAETQTINRGDRAFTAQVAAFADAGCTVIFAITVPTEQHAMLAEAASQGLDPVWLGLLPTYLNLFAAGAPDLYAKYYVALDSPELTDTSVPGIANFLERFERYGSGAITTFVLSGYFLQVSVHALLDKAAELGDFSREGIRNALAQLGEVDLDGLAAENYVYGTPENRRPTSAVRIKVFDPTRPPNFLRDVMIVDSPLNDEFDL